MADDSEKLFQEEQQWVTQAMKRRTQETVESVKRGSDISPWVKERPLTSVLAAAAGGAVFGFLATPSRRAAEEARAKAVAAAAKGRPPRAGFMSHLETEVFRTLRPALRAFAASAAGALFANVHLPGGFPGHGAVEEPGDFPRHNMQI